jgi:fibronectin type 3 domain-containing protein
MKNFYLSFIIMALFSTFLSANSILVTWDKNTGDTTAGYNVYWNTTGLTTYPSKADAGAANSYIISNATSGKLYYVAVSAYDSNKNESFLSTPVVSATIPPNAPKNVKTSILQAMINWVKHLFG